LWVARGLWLSLRPGTCGAGGMLAGAGASGRGAGAGAVRPAAAAPAPVRAHRRTSRTPAARRAQRRARRAPAPLRGVPRGLRPAFRGGWVGAGEGASAWRVGGALQRGRGGGGGAEPNRRPPPPPAPPRPPPARSKRRAAPAAAARARHATHQRLRRKRPGRGLAGARRLGEERGGRGARRWSGRGAARGGPRAQRRAAQRGGPPLRRRSRTVSSVYPVSTPCATSSSRGAAQAAAPSILRAARSRGERGRLQERGSLAALLRPLMPLDRARPGGKKQWRCAAGGAAGAPPARGRDPDRARPAAAPASRRWPPVRQVAGGLSRRARAQPGRVGAAERRADAAACAPPRHRRPCALGAIPSPVPPPSHPNPSLLLLPHRSVPPLAASPTLLAAPASPRRQRSPPHAPSPRQRSRQALGAAEEAPRERQQQRGGPPGLPSCRQGRGAASAAVLAAAARPAGPAGAAAVRPARAAAQQQRARSSGTRAPAAPRPGGPRAAARAGSGSSSHGEQRDRDVCAPADQPRDAGERAAGALQEARELPRAGTLPLVFLWYHRRAAAGDRQHLPAAVAARADRAREQPRVQCARAAAVRRIAPRDARPLPAGCAGRLAAGDPCAAATAEVAQLRLGTRVHPAPCSLPRQPAGFNPHAPVPAPFSPHTRPPSPSPRAAVPVPLPQHRVQDAAV
jgi:hypothetical protein